MNRPSRFNTRKVKAVVQAVMDSGLPVSETIVSADGTIRVISSRSTNEAQDLDSPEDRRRKLNEYAHGKN